MSTDQREEKPGNVTPQASRSDAAPAAAVPSEADGSILSNTGGPSSTSGHGGSLRSKLVLSLAAMFFLFLTIDEMVREKVIRPSFASIERNAAILDSNRVLSALNAEISHLADLAAERARWMSESASDIRLPPKRSVLDPNPERPSVADSGSTDTIWSLLICPNESHQWLSDRHQPTGNDVHSQDASSVSEEFVRSMDQLCRGTADSHMGMMRVGQHDLFMFAAIRLDSQSEQDFLVVARPIGADIVASLRRQTQVDFFLDASPQSIGQEKLDIWEVAESTFVEVRLVDPFGRASATLLVDVPRDLSLRSNQTSAMARQSFILGASAALLFLLLLLQRIVISPLTAIREYSERVTAQGLQTDPLIVPRNDEIGELARAFERMMQRLGSAQIRLASASRAAGMSQVADTVIHNVGNVLTNVNSLLESATDRVTKLRVEPIGKLASRLKEAQADSALTQAMPEYLHGLAGSLERDQQELSELLTTLNDNIRHIHDVIRDQRRHATKTVGRDRIDLSELISEAIRCCQSRLDRDNVKVEIAGPISAVVESDRSMLLQVVINIIGNARQAMRDVDEDRRALVIRSKLERGKVQLSFQDSGCGMTEATLANIFEAHYTTRDQGSGLGLHFCAITLQRLGGSIRAQSNGIDQGSTFFLDLPFRSENDPIELKAIDSDSIALATHRPS